MKKVEFKKFKYLSLFLIISMFLVSCNDEEACDYNKPCDFNQTNTEYSGWTVATCFARQQNGDVAVIFDTRYNSNAPVGDDWGTTTTVPTVTAIHPSNWKANEIGQVFGIAIDDNENIYLASTDIYSSVNRTDVPSVSSNGTTIFKCSGSGYLASPFLTTIPSSSDPLNDIGNIAYDKVNNQLFATNLEDGKIYRITGLNNTTGTIAETYDPWGLDSGAIGIVNQEEQIWGIGVNYENNNVKVYFPRVDILNGQRSIYSITLNPDGSFPSNGNEIVEVSGVPGDQNIISDIAFSSDTNEMIIAEKGEPHGAQVISFSLNSSWNLNKSYFIGAGGGENSAGGIDFAYKDDGTNISSMCDDFFWASGHLMSARNSNLDREGYVYGLQGISYSGNNSSSDPIPTANQDTDLFIDFDGSGSWNVKGTIGDVEVFDANTCYNLCDY